MHSGREWPDRCSILGCNNKAECGLHIREVGEKKEYIVPGCRECNPRTDEFDLKTDVVRVDANTQTV